MTNIIFIISVICLLLYTMLLVYYRVGWASVPGYKTGTRRPSTFITVIIPARNEQENLPALLTSLSRQTYCRDLFEVVVIDDHSTDDTVQIAAAYDFVTCISLEDFIGNASLNSYKKKAIETGIQQSTGELIVTTDADCTVPGKWLETIAAFYEEKHAAFIVMPVAIQCSASAVEVFQALDFMTLQGITAASVHKKMHSMCNGANLAYTRRAYHSVDGFRGIDAIASGDDMLLMHKIAVKFPEDIHYLKSTDVIVQTAAVKTIREFFNQRIRWASKADKYDDKRIFRVLLLVYLFNVILLLLPAVALITAQTSILLLTLAVIALKTMAELFFLFPVALFFGSRSLLWLFPLAQPFHIVYTVIAGWLGKFGSYRWKERKVI